MLSASPQGEPPSLTGSQLRRDLTGRVRRPAANERLKRSHSTKALLAWAGGPGTLAIRRPP